MNDAMRSLLSKMSDADADAYLSDLRLYGTSATVTSEDGSRSHVSLLDLYAEFDAETIRRRRKNAADPTKL